jgi:uncharacterized protein YqeY
MFKRCRTSRYRRRSTAIPHRTQAAPTTTIASRTRANIGGSVVSESGLKDEIQTQMQQALKAGDKIRLGALRMLVAGIKNREIELQHELSDDEVREVAGKEVKKRAESIEAFDNAGRTELADKERAEREVLLAYAPDQLPEEAVDALVDEAITATGATSAKEMGKVMGFVMSKAKGQVDGSVVQQKVRARLGDG